MMGTTLRSGVITAGLIAVAVGAAGNLLAQGGALPKQSRPGAGEGQANDTGQARLERPESNEMRLPEISPQMYKVLKNWELATAKIKRLHVQHYRHVYDATFLVEKLSEGELFFEAPDKGRINIRGIEPKKPTSDRRDLKTGKPYTCEADTSEQWICDGKFIWQVDEKAKTITEMPLPKEVQGLKIMDTPMPFLFGMPVDQARQRYDLSFSPDRPDNRPEFEVWLDVKPRLPQDAANWSSAKVILDSRNYLPRFVKMIDPGGNLETVYQFGNAKINRWELPWQEDYKPPKVGYEKQALPVAANPNPNTCPSLIGLNAKNAAKVLEQAGYEVKWHRGEPARRDEFVYVVYEQFPEPKTPLPKGATINLRVYDKVIQVNSKPVVPGTEDDGRSATRRESSTE